MVIQVKNLNNMGNHCSHGMSRTSFRQSRVGEYSPHLLSVIPAGYVDQTK
jgi:hypothetical protein